MRNHLKNIARCVVATTVIAAWASIAAMASEIDTHTRIFDSNFRTLQVRPSYNELAPPVITQGTDETLLVTIDEMTTDRQYLRYKVIHCNADWQPSMLVGSEYVDGFNEGIVDTVNFSTATLAQYVNYKFRIPGDDMKLKVSGNYLLQIYPENEPENLVAQVRFYVSEEMFTVEGDASSRTDIDMRARHQQVELSVSSRSEALRNWSNDIKVYVSQNSRYDNEVLLSHPNLIEQGKAVYTHDRKLIFPAGNEFRRFEFVSTNYKGKNVAAIEYEDPYYHAILNMDEPRAGGSYLYDRTQYGRFKVRQSDVDDSDANADYIVAHFSLYSPRLEGVEVYIDGDFTQHQFSPRNRMRYDSSVGGYVADMFIKMGSYNYQYLCRPSGSTVASSGLIEGDFYPTVNEYMARVYYRPQGADYDRLVGYSVFYPTK